MRIFSNNKTAKEREVVGAEEAAKILNNMLDKDFRGREAPSKKDVYWPWEFLRADLPTARTMTFGYNIRVTKGYKAANQGNIFSHARDLLYALHVKRRKVLD